MLPRVVRAMENSSIYGALPLVKINNSYIEKHILLVIDQRPIQHNQRECYANNAFYGRSQRYSQRETRPSLRVHWVACGMCSVPGNFFQVGVCSRYNARSDWLIVTGPRADYGLAKTKQKVIKKPYNKLLTNRASSSHTGEYWPWVVFVRTSLR